MHTSKFAREQQLAYSGGDTMSNPRAALGMLLPLAFHFGGAHGFGYTQTVDGAFAETPPSFSRTCAADCPQCTPITVTNVEAQDLSDASGCVCVEGSIRAGSGDYDYPSDSVVCEGAESYCDCGGDCEDDEASAWCQCDEAQACCSGDAEAASGDAEAASVDAEAATLTWTLTPYDDCAFLGPSASMRASTPAPETTSWTF